MTETIGRVARAICDANNEGWTEMQERPIAPHVRAWIAKHTGKPAPQTWEQLGREALEQLSRQPA